MEGDSHHYVWIKNLSRLVRSQLTKHKSMIHLCNTCLLCFYNEQDLLLHKPECNRVITSLPSNERQIIKFEKYERQLDIPFVVYADFECVLQNISSCSPNPTISSTEDIQIHVPCSYVTLSLRLMTILIFSEWIRGWIVSINFKHIVLGQNETFEIRFLDSFRFMSSSLDTLSSCLTDNDLISVRKTFISDDYFKLARKKGIFPYEYLNSFEILDETALPEQKYFNNKFSDSICSDEDYGFAKTVWEKFRYPCHYYTAPGLSWDAMLKKIKVELVRLLNDINMYNFIKKGIRGGITQCSLRHSIVNNKYTDNFDNNQPSYYITYFDVNNLYGWAMSHPLPLANFKWCDDINSIKVENILDNSPKGYILEVDLEYPSSKHNTHNDLPFCAENKRINNMKCSKLICDLNNKERYIIHYKNLKHCLEHGLILKKIHRILEFDQSCWLKPYIEMNNSYRTNAKNDFEKFFFKLLNNAVYGKTMENIDKRRDVKIVTSWESNRKHLGARDLIAKPNFHSITHFTNEMAAIEMKRVNVYYNKPIYVGFTVLEISKWKIDIKDDIDTQFDTSGFPENNTYNIPLKNKKVLGMMKDECDGNIIKEFVGLRAKISKNHTLYTQALNKVTLTYLDDKRFIKKNNIETLAWGHFSIE
ncbi:uncharacterized protein LOC129613909 [Condylostylus longicornis]|uniref:uncharacterized protein LOC129613909 n=1 Tax=Condylostylus longicornis TaxID=2530218 RepID=UPI00244E52D6|nr:uncharacterized protein LOC129613909 [Condylostylus longicornis]